MRTSHVLMALAIAALVPTSAAARQNTASDEINKVQAATTVLQALTTGTDERIPQHLLERAEAVVVIPNLIKGGFVIGARHGTGIMSVKDRATNAWSAPAFVNLTGASIGWQIGVESVDLVLLVMNRNGVDQLLEDKFTIGGNLSLAAGPVGRSGEAATNAQVNAQILAYSRAKGLFAGATLEGSALHADDSGNKAFYGSAMTLRQILATPSAARTDLPAAAAAWNDTLKRLTAPLASPAVR